MCMTNSDEGKVGDQMRGKHELSIWANALITVLGMRFLKHNCLLKTHRRSNI
jgi:hypothetical protein